MIRKRYFCSQTRVVALCVSLFLTLPLVANVQETASSWKKELKWAKEVGARTLPKGKKTFRIEDFGAVDSKTVSSTKAIQAAIDACNTQGGGVVIVPPGNFLTGSIYLKEGVHLKLSQGATLWGSTHIEDYPEIDTRVAGIEMKWPSALINVMNTKNVKISGNGTVHAQGKVFWELYWSMRKEYDAKGLRWIVDYDAKRPRTLLVSNSSDVTLEGLTLQQAGFWTVQILYSEYCTVRGLVIQNNIEGHGPSTDGVDIDSSSRILVEDCDIDCNDDNFCLKAGRDADGLRVNRPTEYIVIRNCLSRAGGGLLTCGSETSGGIRYVYAHDLRAKGTSSGIRLKSAMTRGGTTSHIYVENITMDEVGIAFDATNNWNPSYSYSALPKEYEGKSLPAHWVKMLEKVQPAERGIPYFNHVYLSNIRIKTAKRVMAVTGSESSYMEDFFFDNMDIHAEQGGSVNYGRNWTMTNMKIVTDNGKPVSVTNSQGVAFVQGEEKITAWPSITKEAKPWVRWWWLGSAVSEKGLTYNLDEMAKAGMGGVEITPIYGVKNNEANNIEYLSPKWMEMLAFTQDKSRKSGMDVDLNNGTGWPFGGPNITTEYAASKAIFQNYLLKKGQRLTEKMVVNDRRQKEVAVLQRVMGYDPSGKAVDLTSYVDKDNNLNWSPTDGDYELIALFCGKTLQQVKRAAPGGQGLVLDHLNKEAVTHYFQRFDKAFGEKKERYPHNWFNDSYEVYGANWTPSLLQEFERRRGYKLENYFKDLLAEGATEQSQRVISDYRETIGEILMDNFTLVWNAWAHRHGTLTRNQAHGSPANIFDLYAAVDIPETETYGITDFDIPGLRKDSIKRPNDGDPATLRYASSAAHVAGKKYTSCETFTWLTEHFRTSLSQCKPEIDLAFVSGINHVYFHGAAYSPQEAAWPGWRFYASVNMSPTDNWWKDAPALYRYIARTQSFLQEGTPDNDFLLYFPVYDVWAEQKGSYYFQLVIHGMRDRLPDFYKAVEDVRSLGYGEDYISDKYILSSSVENGRIKTVGGATYKALIIPAVKRMTPATLAKLKDLAEQGATIVFMNHYPSDVPGLSAVTERLAALKQTMKAFPEVSTFEKVSANDLGKGRVLTGTDLEMLLEATNVAKEPFVSELGGQAIRRKNASGYHYFLAMLQNKPIDGWVPLAVNAKSAMLFNPMDGTSGMAKIRTRKGVTEVYLQLKPGESLILKTFTTQKVRENEWTYLMPEKKSRELNTGWTLSFEESEPAIKETFQINAPCSWTTLPNPDLKRNMGKGIYKTSFVMDDLSADEYLLQLGDVRESARVRVNGVEVATLFAVPFEVNSKKYLRKGENTLEVIVSNLPANRIADFDRRKVNWRIFEEINFVSITYQESDFSNWETIPSGLLGPVRITACTKRF